MNAAPAPEPTPDRRRARVHAVDAGVPPQSWRRVHPVSPVLNAWKALAALLAVIVYQNAGTVSDVMNSRWARERGSGVVVVWVLLGILLFLLVAGLYSWLAWRATSFAVTPDAVWYRAGILFRQQRHARLDRVQSVNVVHPLLGRIFGLGRLSVEVAGGSGSSLEFGYLRTAELEDLRAEILARAAGLHLVGTEGRAPSGPPATPTDPTTHEGAPALVGGEDGEGSAVRPGAGDASAGGGAASPAIPVPPELALYTVPPGRLVVSLFLSGGVLTSLLAVVALVVGAAVAALHLGPAALSGIWGVAPALLGVGSYLWGRFAGEFNFEAAVSADGIRIRRGLTETRSQTIPPRRIHAVRIVQPWLWRGRGWYRVTVSQAGYGGGGDDDSSKTGGGDVLLPVGTLEQARLATWLVVRDLGVSDPAGFVDRAFDALPGEEARTLDGFVPNPAPSRWLDPWSWRRRAVALTGTVLAVREGRLTRTLCLAPVERVQSVSLHQGPWMRSLGLASLHMEIVPGSVHLRAAHADQGVALDLLDRLLATSRQRRAAEPPEKWMLRVARAVSEPTPGDEGEDEGGEAR